MHTYSIGIFCFYLVRYSQVNLLHCQQWSMTQGIQIPCDGMPHSLLLCPSCPFYTYYVLYINILRCVLKYKITYFCIPNSKVSIWIFRVVEHYLNFLNAFPNYFCSPMLLNSQLIANWWRLHQKIRLWRCGNFILHKLPPLQPPSCVAHKVCLLVLFCQKTQGHRKL